MNMNYYTLNEIKKHNTVNDCWLIAHNKVYNVTDFIKTHPIGSDPITKKAGQDCTVDYDFHVKSGRKVWEKYKIGYIKTNNCCIIN